ncbi:MAG: hypothetical protein A2092_13430 [Rhodobacteraceae bacterium GWE1_64_9]|nr:MAG: hypothetical protein A2092_13430 [Rhodobacteraceae bacterium GWE1_64_9]OHC48633.1 MAG: hypothetical protein A2X69_16670 [Rhodobacteraceae bacterium GWF1_65_7]HBD91673.1 hypothetical protein [Gemmobacter sp.]HBU16204.1 hypothetical protein [Gemmobacter sp.]
MRRVLAILLLTGLAACQMTLPWQKDGAQTGGDTPVSAPVAAAAGAIVGGPISVTALPPPAPASAAVAVAAATPAPVAVPPAVPVPPAVTVPEEAAPVDGAEVPALVPAVPAVLKTEEQVACERRGGSWSPVPGSSARSCVNRTRDAGKSCRKRSDCEGECLARSRSCAPIRPLFGCNDILQADGRQVTLCID